MELLHFIKLVLRWWWMIALSVALSGAGAFFVMKRMQPVYAASTIFAVTIRSNNLSVTDQEILKVTYQQLLYQRSLLELVVKNLNLDMDPGSLQRRIDVTSEVDSRLIQVTVEDSDAQRAAAIANELTKVLIREGPSLLGFDRLVRRADLQVLEIARPASKPIWPKTTQLTLLWAFIGGVVAVGIAGGKEFLDTTVQSRDHIEDAMNSTMLAAIPRISSVPPPIDGQSAVDKYPRFIESYCRLRARIGQAIPGKPTALVVTSGNQGEGKTTVAAYLALVVARTGQRVILVDADLRNPTLHTRFNLRNIHGVSTLLSQQAGRSVYDYLLPTGLENLELLPAGPTLHHPADMLSSSRLAELIAQLKEHADLVILDSSPLLTVADPLILARACDATLLVVRSGFARMEDLLQIQHQFDGFGIHPLGVVLNRVGKDQASFYSPSRTRKREAQPSSGVHAQPGSLSSGENDGRAVPAVRLEASLKPGTLARSNTSENGLLQRDHDSAV